MSDSYEQRVRQDIAIWKKKLVGQTEQGGANIEECTKVH